MVAFYGAYIQKKLTMVMEYCPRGTLYDVLKNPNEEIIKIKGLNKESIKKNNIDIELLEDLLIHDNLLQLPQNKWYKHIERGNISILNQLYTLRVTGNKRRLVYENDILIRTNPFILDKNEIK